MEKQISLPNGTKEIIKSYFELPLGGKKVKCPYFMNLKGERAGLRVMIGKGTVEEIVHEVMVWAQLKGVGLNKMSTEEIRSFMIKKGIGIDCSGFAVYVLDAWFKEIYHAHLWESLHYKDNSFFEKAGINIVGAFSILRLFNNGWYQVHVFTLINLIHWDSCPVLKFIFSAGFL